MPGRLVLVGTPIGNVGDLSPRAAKALEAADVVACEDTRHTRRLLSAAGLDVPHVVALHQHNEAEAGSALVQRILREAITVALVTDAGMPAVSDPGERVVQAAVAAGVVVEVVPGPTAATTALALSGLDSLRWCFEGFLPRKGRERADRLTALASEPRTSVLYEAPHRVRETVADLAAALGGGRMVAIARELTKLFEEVWRGTLADAIDHLAATEPRGEYTVVVAGAPPAPPPTDDDVDSVARRHLADGLTKRDAASATAEELGVPRRVAYDAVNRAAAD